MHSSTSECAGVEPSRCISATRSPSKRTTGSPESASSAPRAIRRARSAAETAAMERMSASMAASPIDPPASTVSASP